jgi:hypothetical protein
MAEDALNQPKRVFNDYKVFDCSQSVAGTNLHLIAGGAAMEGCGAIGRARTREG